MDVPDRTKREPALAPAGSAGRSAAPAVSGIITCFNEEANIGRCLDSLSWCDEIIVVDSYSTDRTVEIARAHPKVRLHQRKYYGGASQKNWAIDLARNEWIFLLDADERCTPALQQEIQALLTGGADHDAYTVRRRCYFMGRVIRFSGWRRDRVVRVFRRGTAYYNNRRVHEKLVTVGPAPILRNPMEHFFIERFDVYVERINRYGYWGAAQLWRDGRSSGLAHVLIRPIWRLFRSYLLQLGFLDGVHGLVFCMLQAYGTYLKWSLLWSWRVNARRGLLPDLPEFDNDPEIWQGLDRIRNTAQARRGAAVNG